MNERSPDAPNVPEPSLTKAENGNLTRGLAAAIVAFSDDAILTKDLEGRINYWNKGAENIFGYESHEIIGTNVLRLIPPHLYDEEEQILRKIKAGQHVEHYETTRQTKDGRIIDVSVTISPVRDENGRIVGASKIARDITELTRQRREIVRMSQLYDALSQVGFSIVHASNRKELFEGVCEVLVERGRFHAAWIGWRDPVTNSIVPIASCGDMQNYLRDAHECADNRPVRSSPSLMAAIEDRPYVCNDVATDPSAIAWRSSVLSHGWRSVGAFPIRMAGHVCAILAVYAREPKHFRDMEVSLLIEAAANVSFGMDSLMRDEARREAERAVRHEHDIAAAVISNLPGVLFLYEKSGTLLRWNGNLERVTKYDRAEIASMQPRDFFAQSDWDAVRASFVQTTIAGESDAELDLVSKDGELTPYHFKGARTNIDGRECLIGIGIDLTEQRRLDQARRTAEYAARDARSELARVARISLLGEFAATIAHEINQPLAAVVTNGGASLRWLAKEPPDLNEAREAIKRTTRDATRASDIIGNLRKLVTRAPSDYIDVDLNDTVREVLSLLDIELNDSHVEVRIDFLDRLPLVRGDRIQLQQVLINLIMNSIEAMRPIEERKRVLSVRTDSTDTGDSLVEVMDVGVGLDTEALDRLFDRFFSTKAGGTGLGLAISRTIIDNHGGYLSVSPAPVPAPGVVSRFTIPSVREQIS